MGESLTKVLRKVQGIYDVRLSALATRKLTDLLAQSYSFAIESITNGRRHLIISWHQNLLIGLKTVYDRWYNLSSNVKVPELLSQI